jgi:CheY-like chemotaxis protein
MLQRPLRMLIVDDSADDAELMSRALRQGGFAPECVRVDTADAVASALAEERGWDVIACDYRLPRLDAASCIPLAPRCRSCRFSWCAAATLRISGTRSAAG